jgi:hypothetical protein
MPANASRSVSISKPVAPLSPDPANSALDQPDHLTRLLNTQTWRWLLDVHHRLDLVVELFDERLTLLLPGLDSVPATRVRRLLRPVMGDALKELVQRSMRLLTQDTTAIGGFRFSCTPVVAAGRAVGAFLVAEEVSTGADIDGVGKAERLGSWLSGGIERYLAGFPVDDPSEFRQLSSLYRLFDEAIATGSETAVTRVFVEALAVWEDLESRAYVADLSGRFNLSVSLPGSDPAQAPSSLRLDPQPARGTLTRLAPGEQKRLGFSGTEIVLALIEGRATAQWLFAASVPADARQTARVSLYLDVLVHALTSATAIRLSRLTWAMTQHLLLGASPQDAVSAAMGEFNAAIEESCCFSLFRSDGVEVLTVGETASILNVPAPMATPRLLILPVAVPRPFAAVIGARKTGAGAFSGRDEKLFETTATILSKWLASVIQRLSVAGDRRLAQRTFDQVVAQYESDAATPDDLSLIVISIGSALASPRLARDWINELRGQLRPTDLVGRLLSGELGILLLHTAEGGAQVVVQRLNGLIADWSRRDVPADVKLGTATRQRGAGSATSLVEQARARL